MNCPNCHQVVDVGAAFCGNCGQALQVTDLTPIAQASQNQSATQTDDSLSSQPLVAAAGGVPPYAFSIPAQHIDETKALLALLLGIAGLVGALFFALLGLTLGVIGIIMGTLSRSSTKRGLSTVGIMASSVAILAALAVWAYAIKQNSQTNHKVAAQNSAPAITTSDLTTPCYSVGFVDKLNVNNSSNSCDMKAFNGQTIEASTDAYKIYANQSGVTNATMFTAIAKQAIDKDVKTNLPNFSITNERVASFAGSPAYAAIAVDKSHDVAVIEEAVFHKVAHGDNVFVLVHAIAGKTADILTLEAQWQWK